ncbi:MAG TPA: cytochrome c3 family protein [Candidatus Methanoperedens sp.]|nr:cytochrome c3 family protein [Candidatus Methanoperedens sp.]
MELEKHARHKPGAVGCEDCHQTATVAAGTRYSVHDHKFDFSQPEVACGECHEAGDERLGKKPAHLWNIQPVKYPEPLALELTCARCHGDRTAEWTAESLQKIRKRL